LHKGDYFKYILDADAIMFAIDSDKILAQESVIFEMTVNAFVACIQIIADYKGAVGAFRLNTPVALLVMKSDSFGEHRRAEIENKLQRLNSICNTRCKYFEIFFVSSTGPLQADGRPKHERKPAGVLEPLEWVTARALRSSLLQMILGRPRITRDKIDAKRDN